MADYQDDPLWHRIEGFALDDGAASLNFTRRLARDNGWRPEFARRVVAEYKRFCYLAFRAGHKVTPSDEVDQAWHLHLVYTRSYWEDFCGDVLGGPLHHGPTRGGAAEGTKFHDWYEATRTSYARLFGEAPPCDIWPEPEIRFGNAAAFRRIDTASHWVLRRPALRRPVATAVAGSLVAATLAACAEGGNGAGAAWAVLSVGVAFAVFVGISTKQSGRKGENKKGDPSPGGSGCGGCGDLDFTDLAGDGDESESKSKGGEEIDVGDVADTADAGGGDSGGGGSGCGGGGCGGGN